jgi:hypothetical protein
MLFRILRSLSPQANHRKRKSFITGGKKGCKNQDGLKIRREKQNLKRFLEALYNLGKFPRGTLEAHLGN